MPWQVVVYRGSRVIQLWKDEQLVYTSKVAVGAPGMETPTGLYYVTVRFKPVTEPFLGTFAFETSAYSKLSEWPGGGVVGLHGTTAPSAARAGRLARLHPDLERDRELPPRPHPARHADPRPRRAEASRSRRPGDAAREAAPSPLQAGRFERVRRRRAA